MPSNAIQIRNLCDTATEKGWGETAGLLIHRIASFMDKSVKHSILVGKIKLRRALLIFFSSSSEYRAIFMDAKQIPLKNTICTITRFVPRIFKAKM